MKHLIVASILGVLCWHLVLLIDPSKNDLTIYYDDDDEPVPMLTNVTQVLPTLKTRILRYGFLPCSCEDLTCGCCANMNIRLFNFQRHACMNFSYDPYMFSIGMNMLMNEESIYQQSVSAKNPPPACLQIPIPYVPTIDFCVRIFDIFTPGSNLHLCMNFESRIERVPVMVLQFDCIQMGSDGVNLLKPEEFEEPTLSPEKEDADLASDVYDEVNEVKKNITLVGNTVKTNGSVEIKNIPELQAVNQTSFNVNKIIENNSSTKNEIKMNKTINETSYNRNKIQNQALF